MNNKNYLAAITLLLLAGPSAAQIFKCSVQGKTVYQEIPCEGGQKVNTSGAGKPDTTSASSVKLQRDVKEMARRERAKTAIADRKVFVGMTSDEVVESWGKPSKINKTISSGSTSEQWIYRHDSIGSDQYLYVDNGVVRSIQTSN